MAKFLTTTGISYELEELIKLAKERVVLVSPYLKLGDKLRMHLEDKDRMKVEMRIIYGKADLQPEESAKLEALKELKLGFLKNLHAKCYMSEDRAILASMNLYEFSQQNNEEMGILVTAADDPALFQAIKDDVGRLIRMSDTVSITVARVPSGAPAVVPPGRRRGRQKGPRPPPRRPRRAPRRSRPKRASASAAPNPSPSTARSRTARRTTSPGPDGRTPTTRTAIATTAANSIPRRRTSPSAGTASSSWHSAASTAGKTLAL